jgi:hypothetical protein
MVSKHANLSATVVENAEAGRMDDSFAHNYLADGFMRIILSKNIFLPI